MLNLELEVYGSENQAFICQINSHDVPLSSVGKGQTSEHAIAIALESLAEHYRNLAEQKEPTCQETPNHRYHVILHYEQVVTEESKFEALHNILLGNVVVENAKRWVIPIDFSLQLMDNDEDEYDPNDE
jgi:hypothetical protein